MTGQTKPWVWTEAEDERLKALVAQGASVVKAAATLKRKIVSVRVRARALGCPFPPPAGCPTEVGRYIGQRLTPRKRPAPPRRWCVFSRMLQSADAVAPSN
jgi:hypothetical protein